MTLRDRLVDIALEWQRCYGVAPHITSAISEYDAALLIGCTEAEYSAQMQSRTAVGRGFDFIYDAKRYQVKANRPSGKPGSPVTLVAKAQNYEWDFLVWLLYDTQYVIQEAWLWQVEEYQRQWHERTRLSPSHMRLGSRLI